MLSSIILLRKSFLFNFNTENLFCRYVKLLKKFSKYCIIFTVLYDCLLLVPSRNSNPAEVYQAVINSPYCLIEICEYPAITIALAGDVDGDGVLTASDARLALRASVGLESYYPGSYEFEAANTDNSGSVTAADARAILRAAVGISKL